LREGRAGDASGKNGDDAECSQVGHEFGFSVFDVSPPSNVPVPHNPPTGWTFLRSNERVRA
jgi:hypothetical protein